MQVIINLVVSWDRWGCCGDVNIAQNKPTYQSSTQSNKTAFRALDMQDYSLRGLSKKKIKTLICMFYYLCGVY